MQLNESLIQPIDYQAPRVVLDAIASLGRTEDIKLSATNRRLAIADFERHRILIFEISIDISEHSKSISLLDVAEITSSELHYPHGLDFIDDDKLLVANRAGEMCILVIPTKIGGSHELTPVSVLRSDHISTPGSVFVRTMQPNCYEALICNNYVNRVTRHQLDLSFGYSFRSSDRLLSKWLDVPDGICVSADGRWILVSNHKTHTILVFENTPSLGESSDPVGVLRRTKYPHGLRFSPDGRFLLVADAGAPRVNIYEKGVSGWVGVRDPVRSVRILSNEDYLRGRHSREHGGPKGIDINNLGNVFVMTSECQPLAFFDLTQILGTLKAASGEHAISLHRSQNQRMALKFELLKGWAVSSIAGMTFHCIVVLYDCLKLVPGLHRLLRKVRPYFSDRFPSYAVEQHRSAASIL